MSDGDLANLNFDPNTINGLYGWQYVSVDDDDITDAGTAGQSALLTQTASGGHFLFSGNQDIDAALIGSKWTITNQTFSFPTAAGVYGAYTSPNNEPGGGVIQFNAAQQTALRYAFNLIDDYTPLTFTEVAPGTTGTVTHRFANTNDPDVGSALGYFPGGVNYAGDSWFGNTGQPFYLTPAVGNWGQATIMHELGHTMGLKHGHQDYTNVNLASSLYQAGTRFGSQALPTNHDGQAWSLMTYRSNPGATVDFQGDGFNQPQTYMQDDIAALQYMYGANFNTNSGNTVYSFSPTSGQMFVDGVGQSAPSSNKIFRTLWDGGGTDTLDLSNYTTNLTVDLFPGQFSTFSTAQLVDNRPLTADTALAPGNLAMSLLYNNDTRSLIENATGGSGNDTIGGNQADNVLLGGAGDDTLIGYTGNDTLLGGAGNDTLYGSEGLDTLYGGDGNDGLYDQSGASSVLSGDAGNDTIYGGAGNDYCVGGDGDDVVVGLGGIDSLYGGAGNDYMVAGDGVGSVVDGGAGANTLWGAGGNDYIVGGEGADLEVGGGGSDYLFGNAGADTLYGGAGTDYIYTNAGNDFVWTDNVGEPQSQDFIYAGGGTGVDTIADFIAGDVANHDVLVISPASGIGNFAQLLAATTQVGVYTVITMSGGDQVYLYNVQPFQLTAADFLFF